MKDFWNQRYAAQDYAYGTAPNAYLKECLTTNTLEGKALFVAEGEGRNAVFAAEQGLDVSAFDISDEGKKKALHLAQSKGVTIKYSTTDFLGLDYPLTSFDVIVLIYAHLPPPLQTPYYNKLLSLLKEEGALIIEGFSENNLAYKADNPSIGGPDKVEFLYSVEKIKKAFPIIHWHELSEKEVPLNEGLYHIGKGSVIRGFGQKR